MGQDNTAVYQKLAMSLLDLLEDMKLQPIREDHRRLAALVHKLDEELHAMFAEERQSITASLAEHRQQLERLLVFMNANSSLPSPAWCEQVAERLRIVEGDTTHLKLLLHQNADKPNAVIHGRQVRMGPPPGVPAIVLARCAPHGKSDCPECGAYAVVDPTAQAYERIVQERDGYRDGQARMTHARDVALKACDDLSATFKRAQSKLQQAFDREHNRLGEVLQLISRPDGHGSPYWSDPPEIEPAEAVGAVLEHLRGKIVEQRAQLDGYRDIAERLNSATFRETEANHELRIAKEQIEKLNESIETQVEKRLEVTQAQLDNFTSACADQSVQIMELRGHIAHMEQAHAAELARKDAQREQDFAEGREQNRRLIEDNQALRLDKAEHVRKFQVRTEEFDTMVSERDRWQAKYNDEHGKRMSAEAKCTEFRGKAFDLEAQLARKDKLIETVQGEASRVPALREAIDGHTKTIERMNALCLTAQRWRESRRSMGASWADSVARNGADAGLVEAIDKFELDSQVAAGAVCDGDCPMVPGTYGEIAHRVGCPEHADPGTDVDDHPF